MTTLILLFDWIGASSGLAGQSHQSHPVTLTAEISVTNRSDKDIEGYTHRISIPVADSLQQELVGIRYEFPEEPRRRQHKRGDSEYIEFLWDVPAKSTLVRKIHFDLQLADFDYKMGAYRNSNSPNNTYLKSAKYIESDSTPIKDLALRIKQQYSSDEDRLRAAFMLPQKLLEYQVQSTRGALSAVKSGRGDCTEYAALFVALARAMGYPARMTSEILFTSRNEFDQPNHHSAEVYLNGGWIPVDANLALDPELGYGFGIGSDKKIVINRDFSWVWSNLWPRSFRGYSDLTDVEVRWIVNQVPGVNTHD